MAKKPKTKTPSQPSFGTKNWVVTALTHKFRGTPERPAEAVSSMIDYLNLGKLQRTLWEPDPSATVIVWVDPDYIEHPEPVIEAL